MTMIGDAKQVLRISSKHKNGNFGAHIPLK
jgi:hypothetical protein